MARGGNGEGVFAAGDVAWAVMDDRSSGVPEFRGHITELLQRLASGGPQAQEPLLPVTGKSAPPRVVRTMAQFGAIVNEPGGRMHGLRGITSPTRKRGCAALVPRPI